MPTLTPQERADEVTWAATRDGLISGTLTLIPAYGFLQVALRNQKFVQSTNWQSRTALVIMPALFMFAYSSESKLSHKMQEVASETEHKHSTVKWAEEQHAQQQQQQEQQQNFKSRSATNICIDPNMDTEHQLTELYRQSVANSGIRVVAGDRLGPHHLIANYWQENPFKVLAVVAIPTVGYIYYGRSSQQHLQLQSKIMHTRVYGQFAVICMLLSLMGFREYMNRTGKFITEAEAERRVEEMHLVRQSLMRKLEEEKKQKERMAKALEEAHKRDIEEGKTDKKRSKKKKKQQIKAIERV